MMTKFKRQMIQNRLKSRARKGSNKSSFGKSHIHFNELPDEVLAEVFSYMCVEDLALQVRHVCQRWIEILKVSRIWKGKEYAPRPATQPDHIMKVLKNSPKLEKFHPAREVPTNKAVLETLISYCPNIKELTLNLRETSCSDLYNLFVNIRENLTRLSVHVFVNYYVRNDTDFIQKFLNLVSPCHKLKYFSLTGNVVLKTSHLVKIASSFPLLVHMDLEPVYIFDSKGWELLVKSKGKNLRSLSFTWLHSIGEKIFILPAKFCPVLEKLSVASIPTLSSFIWYNSCAFQPLKTMVTLRDLTITCLNSNYWGDLLDVLESKSLVNLEKLDLSGIQCDGKVLLAVIFKECTSLKSLSLKGCHNLIDPHFQSINCMVNLEYLNLSGSKNISNTTIVHICECSSLQYLNVDFCDRITTRSLFLCFSKLVNLRELHMNTCSIKMNWGVPNHLRKYLRIRKFQPLRSNTRTLRKCKYVQSHSLH